MGLYSGKYKQYVKLDIKEGSFICYLTNPEDVNLNKPTGRILVKPYINVADKKEVLYSPEQKVYGTAPNNFLSTVNDILSDIQHEKVGEFKISEKLYCDTNPSITRHTKNIQDILDGKTKPKDKSDVWRVLNALNIKNYSINSDLTVDVMGSVSISYKNLRVIPVQFRNVAGAFWCGSNKLTSLEGVPQSVAGGFDCTNNQITSLKGAPKSVGGDFYCSHNKLTSLEGAPQSVGGGFYCTYNKLTTLEGSPPSIGDFFNCSDNKLTTLKGGPKKVGGNFDCSHNELTSLEGVSQSVGGYFYCSDNQPPISPSEKDWAEKNIKAKRFVWQYD
jgi:hypothetical protein